MNTPLLTENDFYDIYSVWYVPIWQRPWFYWTVITIISCALIALLFLFYRYFFKSKKRAQTYWQKTLAALADLSAMPIITQEDGKKFYFALTGILKEYLEHRFGYPLQGKTDSEMASYLKDGDLEAKYKISDICNGGLFIKFANQQAIADQIKKDLRTAQRLVQETVPIEKK